MINETGENLVFILSLPRSGSTLLSAILGNHPQVACPPEPWFLLRLAELRGKGHDGPAYDDYLAGLAIPGFLSQEQHLDCARIFALKAYNARLQESGATVMIDKTPRYYHILPFIDKLFPRARKIWLKRHPLDVAASYKNTWKRSVSHLLGDIPDSVAWDFTVGLPNLVEYFSSPGPEKYELRYEDLVSDPEGEIGRLLAFCALPPAPDMLGLTSDSRGIQALRGAAVGDVGLLQHTEVHRQSLGRCWNILTAAESRRLTDFIGPAAFQRMGYRPSDRDHPEFFLFALTPTERQAARRRVLERLEEARTCQLELLYEKDGLITRLEDALQQARNQYAQADAAHRQVSQELEKAHIELQRGFSLDQRLQSLAEQLFALTDAFGKAFGGGQFDALKSEFNRLREMLDGIDARQKASLKEFRTQVSRWKAGKGK